MTFKSVNPVNSTTLSEFPGFTPGELEAALQASAMVVPAWQAREPGSRCERVARQLQCGCAFVNGLVKSDPRLPFGGIKNSGYGRELSRLGIHEFVNAKTIWTK